MLAALAARRAKADPKTLIDYGLHMTIGPHDIAKLDQIPAVYAAGCASFKLYMAYGLRLHDGELLQALTAVRGVGGLPVVHAENWDVICALIEQNLAAGRVEPPLASAQPAGAVGRGSGRARHRHRRLRGHATLHFPRFLPGDGGPDCRRPAAGSAHLR
ncbi:MAG: hypothetical protein M5U34_01910 [Chloroflexi bacterium]|nr:hypothetical protein [Chloroflexota bacterium]